MTDVEQDAPLAFVVCVKAHEFPAGREVPVGSRWHADDPAVVAAPKNFKKER